MLFAPAWGRAAWTRWYVCSSLQWAGAHSHCSGPMLTQHACPLNMLPGLQVCQANGEVIITNDGATILNKMTVLQPAAKMLVELAKSQARRTRSSTA